MNADRLLAHYEKIADAPDAIVRLRRFILDLAVRGKLVPQDQNDQPAAEFLNRIMRQKAALVTAGEIRGEKPLPLLSDAETSFELPSGWVWVHLGNLSQFVTSGSRDWAKHYSDDGAIFVRMGNLSKDHYRLRLDHIQRVKPPADGEGTRTRLEAGDILVSITGDVGMLGLIPEGFGEAYINQHTAMIRPMPEMKGRFLAELFRSPFAQEQFDEPQRGIKNSFRLTDVTQFVVALPPLAEQHRIVAKVDELMALCDRLEAARGNREAARDRLAAATLARLNAPDPETFQADARFALDALPALTTRPDQIRHLRQTILNLAVRGKLVPQDASDEPASELLKRIAHVKRDLLRTKKLKGSTPITNSISNRESIELPGSWQWASCDELFFVTKLAGFEYTKHFDLKDEGEVPVIRAQNVRPWTIEECNLKYLPLKTSLILERSAVTKPCILITFIGAGIGDVALIDAERRWHLAPNVAKAESFEGCDSLVSLKYVVMFFNSPTGRAEIFKHVKTTAQPSLSMGTIRDVDVVVPPLAEQHRIVAKVDTLMALCDQLEASLAIADETRRRLLEALLAEVLAPAEERELEAAE
jgi:type I restriction enzyme S subunit